jgi:geranylgeranyl diphosphate synthase, type II
VKQTAAYHTLIEKTLHEKRYGASPKELYEPVDYIMSLGGKRMRPLLVLMACEMFDGDINQALNSAIGIELFHNFTLIHDDIMDNAPLRRNKATVHERWNTNIAILSGDVMMVESYKEFCKLDNTLLPAVLDVFNDTAKKVCEGQQMDMNYETISSVSIEQYVQMITLKTAVLLGGSLKIGALIGRASEEHAQLLYDFGKNMGIAFQLQDDILDVYGNTEKFGKQQGGDIIANKKTYLLLKAMELSENDSKLSAELSKWMNVPAGNDAEKVKAVTAIFNTLHIKTLAEQEMNTYYDKAMRLLESIPVEQAKKQGLIDLSNSIMQRES